MTNMSEIRGHSRVPYKIYTIYMNHQKLLDI